MHILWRQSCPVRDANVGSNHVFASAPTLNDQEPQRSAENFVIYRLVGGHEVHLWLNYPFVTGGNKYLHIVMVPYVHSDVSQGAFQCG